MNSWDLSFPNHLRLSPYLASASSANMVKAGKAAEAAYGMADEWMDEGHEPYTQ